MSSDERLLDGDDHRLIRQLSLTVKRRITGLAAGEQRSPALGGGIEFADYRAYMPGDDIRQVDWSVFLRMRRLMIKLGAEERELTVVPILDTSRSMQFGDPNKFLYAKKICSIIGGIALETGNRTAIVGMADTLTEIVPPSRDSRSLTWIGQALLQVKPTNHVDYRACMRQFASRWGGRCLAIFVSDLLFDQWETVVSTLAASTCEAHLVQVLAPDELDPQQQGELTFVDLETDEELPLHLDAHMQVAYHQALETYRSAVASQCHRLGMGFASVSSATPIARMFQTDLRRAGIVW